MLNIEHLENVEYIGEEIFLHEVEAFGEIWVARGVYQNVYIEEMDEAGFSLPVWSNRVRVIDFLKNARLVGPRYDPHPVPLDLFTNTWLSDKMMAIMELQINPDGKASRVLCLTVEEFRDSRASK